MDGKYWKKMDHIPEKSVRQQKRFPVKMKNKVLENRKCYDILRIGNIQGYVCVQH